MQFCCKYTLYLQVKSNWIQCTNIKKTEDFISLTVQEIRRFVKLIFSSLFTTTKEAFLSLSLWRRRHQARAKDCHFKDKERTRVLYAQSLRL